MDRDALDSFDLMDNVEKELGIDTCPVNWPIGSGKNFKGVYDLKNKELLAFEDTEKGTKEGRTLEMKDMDSIRSYVGDEAADKLSEEL